MISSENPKTIDLGGRGVPREAAAAGAITPGMLLAYDTSLKVKAHDVEGASASPMFATEYDFAGKGIDDAYAADDQVRYTVFSAGSRVYAWLAAGQNITTATYLMSDGAGRLKTATAGKIAVAQAIEAVTTTTDPARIRVEIIPAQAYTT